MSLAPRCFLVGARPVRVVPTADGGLDVLAWDFDRRELARDMSLLARLFASHDADVEEISEAELEARVRELRAKGGEE